MIGFFSLLLSCLVLSLVITDQLHSSFSFGHLGLAYYRVSWPLLCAGPETFISPLDGLMEHGDGMMDVSYYEAS